MAHLTIKHNRERGTYIEGTARGDGTNEILKAHGWRWGRSISVWFVPHSRDREMKTHVVNPTKAALEAARHIVTIERDETPRTAEEVEADAAARAARRAEYLEAKAQRRAAAAEKAHQDSDRAAAQLPPGGEPIKVGHHSEGRHRNALDRAHAKMGKAVQADRDAEEAQRHASSAAATTAARYSVRTVANKIKSLTADLALYNRRLDGYTEMPGTPYQSHIDPATGEYRERIQRLRDETADKLHYWKGVRADQIETGTATNYTPEMIAVGDHVQVRGPRWWQVARVNKKSVTLISDHFHQRIDYELLTGHRPASN
ncbi:MAG: hypothetical protein DI613_09850 [Kocuria rhizophila]|nr:MAG: hypothetical protein DI613_09850 [Kocuria rhizophila]